MINILHIHMYTYSLSAPLNGFYLDLWRCINVLILFLLWSLKKMLQSYSLPKC